MARDDKCNGDAALEAGHTQAGQNIVALRASMGKGREPVAEIDDATGIAVGASFVRVGGYVVIEFFESIWRGDV